MTTVINNPGNGDSGDGSVGIIVGAILLIVVVALLIIYGLPMIRGANTESQKDGLNINVSLPAGGDSPNAPANQ